MNQCRVLHTLLPWRERKEKYLAHLQTANSDALLVATADKLHNARTMLSDAIEMGEKSWIRFKALKENQLWFLGAMVETLVHTAAPPVLVDELRRVVSRLNS